VQNGRQGRGQGRGQGGVLEPVDPLRGILMNRGVTAEGSSHIPPSQSSYMHMIYQVLQ
jgi:hypothetical protein